MANITTSSDPIRCILLTVSVICLFFHYVKIQQDVGKLADFGLAMLIDEVADLSSTQTNAWQGMDIDIVFVLKQRVVFPLWRTLSTESFYYCLEEIQLIAYATNGRQLSVLALRPTFTQSLSQSTSNQLTLLVLCCAYQQ